MTLKFYYINLKNSENRNKNMELFFKNLSEIIDIKYERIEAFNGYKENINNYLLDSNINSLYSSLIKERPNSTRNVLLKKGEFGCLYSHLKAINLFLKSNEKYCFICEDDLDPNILNYYDKKVFTKKIKKIISKIDKYGIISLSCVGPYKLFQKIFSKDNSFLNNKFVSFEKG